ncbi:MAG: hypothetical protein AB7V27_12670 [Candidatus Binatia bacterium]
MPSKAAPRTEGSTLLSGLLQRGEEAVGVFVQELTRNPPLRDQFGKALARAADAKRAVDGNLEAVLAALNVPSRADYKRLLAKMDAIEGRLVTLGMKLDRLLAAQDAAASRGAAEHPTRRASQRRRTPA